MLHSFLGGRNASALHRLHALRALHAFLGAAFAFSAASTALAQGIAPGSNNRTWFEPLLVAPRADTQVRIDGAFSGATGTPVALEDELGLDRRKAAAGLAFGRRIGERWRFEVELLSLQRSGDALLSRGLQIGDSSFAAGSTLHTTMQQQFYRIAGGYSLLRTDSAEVGIAIGGTISHFVLDLLDVPVAPFVQQHTGSVAMPLLGLYFSAALAPSWQISGRVEGGSDSNGQHGTVILSTAWRIHPNLALGAGWRQMRGHVDGTDFFALGNARFDYRLGGPQAFVNLSF
jgi:hypothetical protein